MLVETVAGVSPCAWAVLTECALVFTDMYTTRQTLKPATNPTFDYLPLPLLKMELLMLHMQLISVMLKPTALCPMHFAALVSSHTFAVQLLQILNSSHSVLLTVCKLGCYPS